MTDITDKVRPVHFFNPNEVNFTKDGKTMIFSENFAEIVDYFDNRAAVKTHDEKYHFINFDESFVEFADEYSKFITKSGSLIIISYFNSK